MTDKFWEGELKRRYEQRDKMFHEIGLLLEDTGMLQEIGDKDYLEFVKYIHDRYELLIPIGKRIERIRGHKMALIKYYCETFNTIYKGEGSEIPRTI